MKDIKKPGIAKNESGFYQSGFVFSSICKAPASRSKSAHGVHYAKPVAPDSALHSKALVSLYPTQHDPLAGLRLHAPKFSSARV